MTTRLFELLSLEGFQAGLSWLTILRKRESFRQAFAGFSIARVADFDERDVERLLGDAGIIRHRGKIEATIGNAVAALELPSGLSELVWSFAPPRRSMRPSARARATRGDARVDRPLEGAQAPRFPVCRPDHGLCLHAVGRLRRRPPRGLPRRGCGGMSGDRTEPSVPAGLAGAASAVVSDVLDRMGRRDRVLDQAIRPLWPEARCVGVAVPVVIVADSSDPELPYDGELTALDGLRPGEVPVLVVEPGVRAASWGELFSCAAIGRGAAGVVVDGFVRDASQITALGFPTFARGLSPLDTFGRAVVTGIGVEAVVGGVEVAPGDLIVGDADGIVSIPRALAADVAEAVATKHRLEGNARDDLLAGLGIREVWEKYGVL